MFAAGFAAIGCSAAIARVAAIACVAPSIAQTPPQAPLPTHTVPGLSRWVYHLASPLPEWPVVVEGQTPNTYDLVTNVADMRDPLPCDQAPLDDHFAGELHGWLRIDAPGVYDFELTGDDGARLILDGTELADTWQQPNFRATASMRLAEGLHTLRIPFFENEGKFRLAIRWRTPNAAPGAFTDIPPDNLRTEPGRTFATSPGPKRWHRASEGRAPGDTRPLVAPHPAYLRETFHTPTFDPHVGAMCFLPSGELAVSTWDRDGAVYLLDSQGIERLYAQGLGEPLGLAWFNGALHATQKSEVTRLEDRDGDGVIDTFTPVAQGFPQSPNYHEFTFNLVPWRGRLWFATSVPLRSGLTNYMPGSDGDFTAPNGPGSLWSVDPSTGRVAREATGMRTPNGMGVGVDGELFGCDNQGSWLPASRLNHLVPGGFYGHQEMRGESRAAMPPVVWFPHGEIGNSPSEPVLVHDGPHRGQMYVGDVTYGGVQRVDVERIERAGTAVPATGTVGAATEGAAAAGPLPQYQGTVFMHSQGLEAGVNRLAWGPDGALYIGGVGSNGNWNHLGRTFGLERLMPAWNAVDGPDAARAAAFEILRVRTAPDGLVLTFTAPVARDVLANAAHYRVHAWRYEPTEAYGGPKVGAHRVQVERAEPSADGRQVRLVLDSFKAGEVVHVRLVNLHSLDGASPWSTESWTTVNAVPERAPSFERFVGSPARPARAIALLDAHTGASQFR
ncbi:MAG: hypothetical protein JNK53_07990, partial [Phycisphaerae bacterium]|nr:hypothetical protein [Phycisphaerae bacterium]